MDIENRPLRGRRNAPFAQTWTYTDADGEPLDFTGATAAMQVRHYGAQPGDSLIDLGVVTTALTQGVRIGAGTLSVFISRTALRFLPTGRPGTDVVFTYDLVVTLPDRVAEVWSQGRFTVSPAVTDRLGLLKAGPDFLVAGGAKLIAG